MSARRLGGIRAAEKRAEARGRFLDEIERVDPGLLPLARELERRVVPYRPEGQSRAEWFLNYAQEHPGASSDAIERSLPSSYAWPMPHAVGSTVESLCELGFNPASTEDDRQVYQWLPATVAGYSECGQLVLRDSGAEWLCPIGAVREAA